MKFHSDSVYLFFPKTEEQSVLVQKHLFKMGFSWAKPYGQTVRYVKEGVTYGYVLDRGILFYSLSSRCLAEGIPVDVERFIAGYKEDVVVLNGKKYLKKDLEEALKNLKPVEN